MFHYNSRSLCIRCWGWSQLSQAACRPRGRQPSFKQCGNTQKRRFLHGADRLVTSNLKYEKTTLGIVGAPLAKGQKNHGVSLSPQAIRGHIVKSDKHVTSQYVPHAFQGAGLLNLLEKLEWKVTDYGDLEFDGHDGVGEEVLREPHDGNGFVMNPAGVGRANKKISSAVERSLRENECCLLLGGDHSTAIGGIHGFGRVHSNACIIWVDAHVDLNTPISSWSGHAHGMSAAYGITEMMRYQPKIPGFEWWKPTIQAKDIVYIGIRDVDPAEQYLLRELDIKNYSMYHIEKYGISRVMEMALDALNPKGDRPIYLSFDIDALDSDHAPCTGTPVDGGLTMREGMYIAEELYNTRQLTMVELVEINPELGNERDQVKTLNAALYIIQACLGRRTAGNCPDNFSLQLPDNPAL